MKAGMKHSAETVRRISESRKGKGLGNKNALGNRMSEEAKARIRQACAGERSYKWTGDDVTYDGIHLWIGHHHGSATHCELADETCSKTFHWSNISGEYSRDMSDWWQLCVSHHKRYDLGRLI